MRYFRKDIERYFYPAQIANGISYWQLIKAFIFIPQLWVIGLYRYRRWVNTRMRSNILRLILKIPQKLIGPPLEFLIGVHIAPEADIGEGLYIGHYGSIWIGAVKMGDNCNISQEVTIGMGGRGITHGGVPEIGNRVFIAPGAKIFGCIKIGDRVAIGANSVLSKSVPDDSTILGNPGRIIGYKGSDGLVITSNEEQRKD